MRTVKIPLNSPHTNRPGPASNPTAPHWHFLALLSLVLALYGRTLSFDFLHYDDNVLVTENPRLYPFHWQNLVNIWTGTHAGIYMPLTDTFWMILAQVAALGRNPETAQTSLAPWVFHLGNLSLFVLVVILVYRLLLRLIPQPTSALLGAAFFAAHPAQIESVAWISEAKGLLAAVLGFAALNLFLVANDTNATQKRLAVLLAATTLYALALLAKPAAVAIPIMAIVLVATVLPDRQRNRSLLCIAVWLLVAAAASAWTSHVQRDYLNPQTLDQKAAFAAEALFRYSQILLLPRGTVPEHGYLAFRNQLPPDQIDHGIDLAMPLVLLAVCISAVAAIRAGAAAWVIATIGLVLAGLLPVLGLVPFGFQEISVAADRYTLLSLFGVAFAIAALLTRFQSLRKYFVVLVTVLSIITMRQVGSWRDDPSLANHAIAKNPASRLFRTQRAILQLRSGNLEAAIQDATRAATLEPPFLPACQNLAVAKFQSGDKIAAIQALKRGLTRAPHDFNLLSTKADILMAARDYRQAADTLQTLVQAHPSSESAKRRLAANRILSGDETGGIQIFQSLEQIQLEPPRDQLLIAQVWEDAGEYNTAIQKYQQILNTWGDVPAAKLRLAWILATAPDDTVRKPDMAIRLASQASQRLPSDSPKASDVLAAALANNNDFRSAIAVAQRALRMARTQNDDKLAREIKLRIERYQQNKPYRQQPRMPINPFSPRLSQQVPTSP